MHDNELQHYGVLGMKWGVRRARKLTAKADSARAKGGKRNEKKAAKKEAKVSKIENKMAKGEKVTHALLESAMLGMATASIGVRLTMNGQAAAGSALSTIGTLGAYYNIGATIVKKSQNNKKNKK